jgi:hypothetical protein
MFNAQLQQFCFCSRHRLPDNRLHQLEPHAKTLLVCVQCCRCHLPFSLRQQCCWHNRVNHIRSNPHPACRLYSLGDLYFRARARLLQLLRVVLLSQVERTLSSGVTRLREKLIACS